MTGHRRIRRPTSEFGSRSEPVPGQTLTIGSGGVGRLERAIQAGDYQAARDGLSYYDIDQAHDK